MDKIKISLNESDIPRQWYNLAADLPMPRLRLPGKTPHVFTSVSSNNSLT